MKLKQIKIDNGQLGRIVITFTNAFFIANIGTFIGVCTLIYSTYLYKYMSLMTSALILCGGAALWFLFFYIVVFPSMMSFQNEQAYRHDSPIKSDFEYIKKELEEIKSRI